MKSSENLLFSDIFTGLSKSKIDLKWVKISLSSPTFYVHYENFKSKEILKISKFCRTECLYLSIAAL